MDNQQNLINQKQQSTNPINPSINLQNSNKNKKNFFLSFLKNFGVSLGYYLLFLFLNYPLSILVTRLFFKDTWNSWLNTITIGLMSFPLAILFGVICGLTLYFINNKRLKFIFIGIALFLALYSSSILVNFKYYTSSGNFLLNSLSKYIEESKMKIVIYEVSPEYDASNILSKVNLQAEITASKTGNYVVESYLNIPESIRIADTNKYGNVVAAERITINLIENQPYKFNLKHNVKPFVEVGFKEQYELIFEARKTDIELKNEYGEKYSSLPMNIMDSGSNISQRIYSETGHTIPIYSIGPYPISQ